MCAQTFLAIEYLKISSACISATSIDVRGQLAALACRRRCVGISSAIFGEISENLPLDINNSINDAMLLRARTGVRVEASGALSRAMLALERAPVLGG